MSGTKDTCAICGEHFAHPDSECKEVTVERQFTIHVPSWLSFERVVTFVELAAFCVTAYLTYLHTTKSVRPDGAICYTVNAPQVLSYLYTALFVSSFLHVVYGTFWRAKR
jgi:hypothetical protein